MISVYQLPISSGYKDYVIVHLGMVNCVVALKIWGPVWANKKIHLDCDNRAVVDILTS